MPKVDWLAPLRFRPLVRPGDYSSSHRSKGADYHDRFTELPGRRLAWRFEREYLEVAAARRGRIESHLDFAGGTGRIAGALSPYCQRQTILDVSVSMLAVAARHVPAARVICGDFRVDPDVVNPGEFDLVTAFRFFPNSEEALRDAAMAFIARALAPGARLICNNHRNFWSVPYMAGRLVLARAASEGMVNGQLIWLASRHGLRFVGSRCMGVVPQSDRRSLLTWSAIERVESYAWKHGSQRHRLGYNVIFEFEKPVHQ